MDYEVIWNSSEKCLERPSSPTGTSQRLDQEGRTDLPRDLYWTAIRADLLNVPSILQSDESGETISEGCAQVEKVDDASGLRMKLSERMAVDAIIEYL